MMFKATKMIADYFTEKGLKYRCVELDSLSVIEAGFSGENVSGIVMRFVSKDDNDDVAIRALSLVKFPESKHTQIQECINNLQKQYRYLKLVIDEDNEISMEYDFPMTCGNVGEVAFEMFLCLSKIIDIIYPELMKCIWA